MLWCKPSGEDRPDGSPEALQKMDDLTNKLVITVDGPAGSGKSTVSKRLAERLSCVYLDTGALYRALAFRFIREKSSPDNHQQVLALCRTARIRLSPEKDACRVLLDGEDVTEKIRTEEVGRMASTLSALPEVRSALLTIQRDVGEQGRIVAEGRDMGTVVFPGATFKFFLEAGISERARRRFDELAMRGVPANYQEIRKDLEWRDRQDGERLVAPLRIPQNAVVIDSSVMTVDEVVDCMMAAIRGK
jgi:CMP/dCMP kinase